MLDVALFRCLLEPIAAGEAGHANRNTLRTALLREKMKMNIPALARDHETELEKKFKMKLAESHNISSENNRDLIMAPAPGKSSHPTADCRSQLSKLIQNQPYGSGGSKPLREYLQMLLSVLTGNKLN